MGQIATIKLIKKDGVALEPEPLMITTTQPLTAVYIDYKADVSDKFNYHPTVDIFRIVELSECEVVEACTLFTCTCDKAYLPKGMYKLTTCPLDSDYYKDVTDIEMEIQVMWETIGDDYVTAVKLNNMCGD